MDKLSIQDLAVTMLIGAYDWEQTTPQTLYIDLTFCTDASKIAKTDHLSDAIDYDKMAKTIQDFSLKHHFQLIETYADRLAQFLLSSFQLTWISLTLNKPDALTHAKNVKISVERFNK